MNKPVYVRLRKSKIVKTIPICHLKKHGGGWIEYYVDVDKDGHHVGVEFIDYESIEIDGERVRDVKEAK